ncbi:MAG TPA: response regulator transcription factor [Candidatus Krumholzibacteria bacterium]|nr:response regulator transcription factor [Candidatus Krumholzibacteria bacterium]
MAEKILVVEDDRSIAGGLEAAFTSEGFEVECAPNGRLGLERARAGKPSLVILDIMLPGMSGLEITKRLRDENRNLPIILLTARGEENDRVLGLELGADDYITKPFSLRELVARVRSVLRRTQGNRKEPELFRFGEVTVDFKRQAVRKGDQGVELSAREFRLLAYFIAHAGTLLTREQLLNDIWGYEVFPTTRTVDNHIARLRKKIEADPEAPQYIRTARGAGYLFEPEGGGGS